MPKVIIVLPAYNEEKSLPPLFAELREVLPLLLRESAIVVVNDGSTDATPQVLLQYQTTLPLHLVQHKKNQGLGPAIKSGLKQALELSEGQDDIIVYMDADNTHSPRYVPQMVTEIDQGVDLVIASRFLPGSQEAGVPFTRRLFSRLARRVFRLFLPAIKIHDFTCGFRAYRVSLLSRAWERFGTDIIRRRGFACTDELLLNLLLFHPKVKEIPFILHYERKQGRSKINLWLTARETITMLFKYRQLLRKEVRTK